jgi:predicted AlkP superfamily pyrophosphatase or phosphodiesterase
MQRLSYFERGQKIGHALSFYLVLGLAFICLRSAQAANIDDDIGKSHTDTKHVVLLSLDGFRHDYIDLHDAKNIRRIASNGVRATSMQPVYPANTFPNHISIVTGLHPTNHGIVNNAFYDKDRIKKGEYSRYRLGMGKDDSTWINATPLWNLVEFNGGKAATFFWPESDARIGGATPTYHFHYSKYANYEQRIQQMLTWLSLPETSRPTFVAGYFSLIDTVGHDEGPTSVKTRAAVQKLDKLVGDFYDKLIALPINIDLVIVSDHGMTPVDDTLLVSDTELHIPNTFIYENEGAQISLYAKPGVTLDDIEAEKKRLSDIANGRFQVLSEAARAQRHFSVSPRTGDIVVEIAPPARFVSAQPSHVSKGGHGYVNTHPDMGALFVAAGPSFHKGKVIGEFSNLEIYPAIAQILGVGLLTPVDAEVAVLKEALVE